MIRGRLRCWVVFACALLLALCAIPRTAPAAWDPRLDWHEIQTPHFRVTYHTGIENVAQHVASTAESIYGHMTIALGYAPKDITEIQLIDNSESANGSAASLPYNALRLIVTAPEDMSPLGDVDDWELELVSHEYTHVLHTDHIRGIPALVNAIVGKTISPNQIQPRWILEGLAVFEESARTSAGRLKNTQWQMFMRADVLENHVAGLDQMSNIVRRWPQGNLFYIYGSFFIDWIAKTYGEEVLRKVSYDYGGQLIPWGMQRTIRRYTGKTYDELFPLWIASLKQRYGAQAEAVRRAGLREGRQITHHGQIVRYPRWIPSDAWPEHAGSLLFYRDDQHTRPGLYAIDLKRDAAGNVLTAAEKDEELIVRTNATESYASFDPDGGLYFSTQEYVQNYFSFNEIQSIPPKQTSKWGTPAGDRKSMTVRMDRATDPAVSPDGRHIVFCRNHAGTRSVHIGDIDPGGPNGNSVKNIRLLAPNADFEQAFTPRWSPDGKHVAYSVWKRGGYRDIRYIDIAANSYRDLLVDRAVDGAPAFSPDGRYLLFHSDRTGIANIYAYELATGHLKQVTNVINGAYMPEVSPDGKTLAYVGYTTYGFDLFAMRYDESTWTDAEEYVDEHSTAPVVREKKWPTKPASPWRTLAPRRYGIQITEGAFGRALIVDASATDISGMHSIAASLTNEFEKPELQGSLSYTYGHLPADFSISAFRNIAPRGGYGLGAGFRPTVIQENTGVASTVGYSIPRGYDSHNFSLSQSLTRTGINLPMPIDKLDPYETPSIPTRGLASTLHIGYQYSNAERYLWSVGPERGFTFSTSFDWTDPALGSDFAGFATNFDFSMYLLMPWLRHHSLALHAGGGTSGGSFPGRGAFFVGSYVDLPLTDTIRNVLIQGGITLRGYPTVIEAGRSYALTNAEYRFPIINVDRGDSTLPVFLNRIQGAAFVDYGSAFDEIQDARFKTGVGAEAWFDFTLGYLAAFTFRLGHARGLSFGGIDKTYFVAAVPF
jgi:hypothetical protein